MQSRTEQSGFFVVHYHSHGADPPEEHAVDSQGDRDREGSRNTTFLKIVIPLLSSQVLFTGWSWLMGGVVSEW